jgi:hypothetical protein
MENFFKVILKKDPRKLELALSREYPEEVYFRWILYEIYGVDLKAQNAFSDWIKADPVNRIPNYSIDHDEFNSKVVLDFFCTGQGAPLFYNYQKGDADSFIGQLLEINYNGTNTGASGKVTLVGTDPNTGRIFPQQIKITIPAPAWPYTNLTELTGVSGGITYTTFMSSGGFTDFQYYFDNPTKLPTYNSEEYKWRTEYIRSYLSPFIIDPNLIPREFLYKDLDQIDIDYLVNLTETEKQLIYEQWTTNWLAFKIINNDISQEWRDFLWDVYVSPQEVANTIFKEDEVYISIPNYTPTVIQNLIDNGNKKTYTTWSDIQIGSQLDSIYVGSVGIYQNPPPTIEFKDQTSLIFDNITNSVKLRTINGMETSYNVPCDIPLEKTVSSRSNLSGTRAPTIRSVGNKVNIIVWIVEFPDERPNTDILYDSFVFPPAKPTPGTMVMATSDQFNYKDILIDFQKYYYFKDATNWPEYKYIEAVNGKVVYPTGPESHLKECQKVLDELSPAINQVAYGTIIPASQVSPTTLSNLINTDLDRWSKLGYDPNRWKDEHLHYSEEQFEAYDKMASTGNESEYRSLMTPYFSKISRITKPLWPYLMKSKFADYYWAAMENPSFSGTNLHYPEHIDRRGREFSDIESFLSEMNAPGGDIKSDSMWYSIYDIHPYWDIDSIKDLEAGRENFSTIRIENWIVTSPEWPMEYVSEIQNKVRSDPERITISNGALIRPNYVPELVDFVNKRLDNNFPRVVAFVAQHSFVWDDNLSGWVEGPVDKWGVRPDDLFEAAGSASPKNTFFDNLDKEVISGHFSGVKNGLNNLQSFWVQWLGGGGEEEQKYRMNAMWCSYYNLQVKPKGPDWMNKKWEKYLGNCYSFSGRINKEMHRDKYIPTESEEGGDVPVPLAPFILTPDLITGRYFNESGQMIWGQAFSGDERISMSKDTGLPELDPSGNSVTIYCWENDEKYPQDKPGETGYHHLRWPDKPSSSSALRPWVVKDSYMPNEFTGDSEQKENSGYWKEAETTPGEYLWAAGYDYFEEMDADTSKYVPGWTPAYYPWTFTYMGHDKDADEYPHFTGIDIYKKDPDTGEPIFDSDGNMIKIGETEDTVVKGLEYPGYITDEIPDPDPLETKSLPSDLNSFSINFPVFEAYKSQSGLADDPYSGVHYRETLFLDIDNPWSGYLGAMKPPKMGRKKIEIEEEIFVLGAGAPVPWDHNNYWYAYHFGTPADPTDPNTSRGPGAISNERGMLFGIWVDTDLNKLNSTITAAINADIAAGAVSDWKGDTPYPKVVGGYERAPITSVTDESDPPVTTYMGMVFYKKITAIIQHFMIYKKPMGKFASRNLVNTWISGYSGTSYDPNGNSDGGTYSSYTVTGHYDIPSGYFAWPGMEKEPEELEWDLHWLINQKLGSPGSGGAWVDFTGFNPPGKPHQSRWMIETQMVEYGSKWDWQDPKLAEKVWDIDYYWWSLDYVEDTDPYNTGWDGFTDRYYYFANYQSPSRRLYCPHGTSEPPKVHKYPEGVIPLSPPFYTVSLEGPTQSKTYVGKPSGYYIPPLAGDFIVEMTSQISGEESIEISGVKELEAWVEDDRESSGASDLWKTLKPEIDSNKVFQLSSSVTTERSRFNRDEPITNPYLETLRSYTKNSTFANPEASEAYTRYLNPSNPGYDEWPATTYENNFTGRFVSQRWPTNYLRYINNLVMPQDYHCVFVGDTDELIWAYSYNPSFTTTITWTIIPTRNLNANHMLRFLQFDGNQVGYPTNKFWPKLLGEYAAGRWDEYCRWFLEDDMNDKNKAICTLYTESLTFLQWYSAYYTELQHLREHG